MTTANKIQKILFIINPISGDVDKSTLETAISDYCQTNQITFQIYKTSGQNDLHELEELIPSYAPDAVFAAGGDGTVNLAARFLNHTNVPLGIIPAGSGNGLSKDMGIPQTIPEALELIQDHEIKAIDTLQLNGIPCFHLSDLGFNALIVAKYNETGGRGPQAYAWIALQEYLDYGCHRYRIETDLDVFEGEAFMITITNSNAFGSNVKINPGGVIDDGIFEICLIESFPKAATFKIMYNLYTETIEDSQFTRVLPARKATIYNYTDSNAQIDGEVVNLSRKIEIEQSPKSLKIVIPR